MHRDQPLNRPVPKHRWTIPDLAPYKPTENDYAFGVRTTVEFDGCGDSYCSGSSGFLHVFRVDGKTIRPILSTLLWSEAHTIGAAKDDGSRDHDTLGDTDPAGSPSSRPGRAGCSTGRRARARARDKRRRSSSGTVSAMKRRTRIR